VRAQRLPVPYASGILSARPYRRLESRPHSAAASPAEGRRTVRSVLPALARPSYRVKDGLPPRFPAQRRLRQLSQPSATKAWGAGNVLVVRRTRFGGRLVCSLSFSARTPSLRYPGSLKVFRGCWTPDQETREPDEAPQQIRPLPKPV